MDGRQILLEILDFYRIKVEKNLCSQAEIESACRALEENMEIHGTVADFAQFFGVTENKVRVAIHRKLMAKPVRRVFYPFHQFREIAPEAWRHNSNK